MAELPDYYVMLGVRPDSDQVVIRAAFKALMIKYHPDTNASPSATRRAAELNSAWGVLGDTAKRAAYDRSLAQSRGSASAKSPPPPPPPPRPSASRTAVPDDPPAAVKSGGYAKGALSLLAGIAIIAVVQAAFSPSKPNSTQLTATDSTAPASDSASAVLSPELAASLPVDAAGAMASNSAGPVDLSETILAYEDIESASKMFDKILQSGGMIGVREYSEACHKAVALNPGWRTADNCAAFDYSASYIDEAMTKAANASPMGYFLFQKDNQADNYRGLPTNPYGLGQRLQEIQRSAGRAVREIIETRISLYESKRAIGKIEDPPVATITPADPQQ